uniref:60S ribosomal protein L21 n=1 Tax=Percolomonas cosmopolitus TaxID=63605 RepID=A0A7S1KPN9_9EUKA|eukprot:CAMPEP_0117434564 /NCGR_PEP_ID=MMETSP0759-20121206/18_1 /TAXON_ID=63605 /ORGANISM="Percolomonas cosmopolitus, Strain WS" /LENGTH=159 /DNA_ID=CAMNT_0005226059 /DNA_START=85 /DNA_END=564 /DNA_ORIENTATION=+
MTVSFGYRQGTRDKFAKRYKTRGNGSLTPYLVNYKLGDYVDIRMDGAHQKGMAHKHFHGKTGVVWNVTPRAVGIEVNKPVRNSIFRKRIYVRVEHVRPSRCREEFLERKEKFTNALRKNPEAKPIKRQPAQPRKGKQVKVSNTNIQTVHPVPFLIEDLM